MKYFKSIICCAAVFAAIGPCGAFSNECYTVELNSTNGGLKSFRLNADSDQMNWIEGLETWGTLPGFEYKGTMKRARHLFLRIAKVSWKFPLNVHLRKPFCANVLLFTTRRLTTFISSAAKLESLRPSMIITRMPRFAKRNVATLTFGAAGRLPTSMLSRWAHSRRSLRLS